MTASRVWNRCGILHQAPYDLEWQNSGGSQRHILPVPRDMLRANICENFQVVIQIAAIHISLAPLSWLKCSNRSRALKVSSTFSPCPYRR